MQINLKSGRLSLMRKRSLVGYIFILPWLLGFLFLFLKPLFQTIQFSFSNVEIQPGIGFVTTSVGFQNFTEAFTKDANFPQLLVDAIVSIFTDIPFILVFSFFSAVLLRKKFVGSSLIKAIFFFTVIMSSGVLLKMQSETAATSGASMSAAISEGAGSINLLKSIQLDRYLAEAGLSETVIGYITGPVNKLFTIISQSGVQVILFIAGLHTIPDSLYEASNVEGATAWESFWKITFPMVSPTILLVVVYSIIDSFTSYNNTMLNYIYTTSITEQHFGYGSAISWIYFIVVAIILAVVSKLISKRVYYAN